jgi:hypothetical protein
VTFHYSEEQNTLADTFRKSLEALCTSEFIRTIRNNPKNVRELQKLFSDLAFVEYINDPSSSFIDLVLIAKECGRTLCSMEQFYSGYISSLGRRMQSVPTCSTDSSDLTDLSFLVKGLPHFLRNKDAKTGYLVGENGLLGYGNKISYCQIDSISEHSSIDITEESYTCRIMNSSALAVHESELVQQELCVLFAAEILGAGEKIFQITNDYVKVRKQYGKTISTFQAVQHQLADCFVKIESAWALCEVAAEQVSQKADGVAFSSRASLAYAAKHIPDVIEVCLQLHGGIGFTWEYDLHLYLRRALKLQALAGLSESALIALCENTLSG